MGRLASRDNEPGQGRKTAATVVITSAEGLAHTFSQNFRIIFKLSHCFYIFEFIDFYDLLINKIYKIYKIYEIYEIYKTNKT